MKKQKIGLVATVGLIILACGGMFLAIHKPVDASSIWDKLIYRFQSKSPLQAQIKEWKNKGTNQYELNHQQEIWLAALEFCESRGHNDAINPKDRDGTPSLSNFQWKPKTFKHYSVKYGLLPPDLEYEDYYNWLWDYELQKEIVSRMMGDKDVKWSQEFPSCSKKFGNPPKDLTNR